MLADSTAFGNHAQKKATSIAITAPAQEVILKPSSAGDGNFAAFGFQLNVGRHR
jgi:hypothetical protein